MLPEKFQRAIELITKSNSPRVSFNVPVNDSYSNVHIILIHECNATLTRKLVEEGYLLYMTDKGLSVSYI